MIRLRLEKIRILVGIFCSVFIVCQGQDLKSHRDYSCDDAGSLDGMRVKRTMEYLLCRKNHENFCQDCRCQYAAYLESAKYCFSIDENYRRRVEQNMKDWEEHFTKECLKGGSGGIPQFSLDHDSLTYCSKGFVNIVGMSWVVIFALTLYLLR